MIYVDDYGNEYEYVESSDIPDHIFQNESNILSPLVAHGKSMVWGLLTISILSLTSPIILKQNLPLSLRSFLLCLSPISALSAGLISQDQPEREKILNSLKQAQRKCLGQSLASESLKWRLKQESFSQWEIYQEILRLPIEQHQYWINRYGLQSLYNHGFNAVVTPQDQSIDVPAIEQKDYSFPESIPNNVDPIPSNICEIQSKAESLSLIDFEVVDVAFLMAKVTTDPRSNGSTLIACPKGTGKSNLLRSAIYHANILHNGKSDFYMLNGKSLDDDESFCGLEKSGSRYRCPDKKSIQNDIDWISSIIEMRCKEKSIPTICIMDEINNIRVCAEISDSQSSPRGKSQKILDASIYEGITKGRSKLLALWLSSHSPYVQDIGVNTAIQQSLVSIVLGRGSQMGALKQVLIGSKNLIEDNDLRENLYQRFLAWIQHGDIDSRVLCLSNIRQKWELFLLPIYPDNVPEI